MKKIFFTYSDNEKDIELYKQFNKHFAVYAKKGLIGILDKAEIFKLNNDRDKVNEFLLSSDLTVPLLSIDYAANDECIKLLDLAADNKKLILPVLLRDFDWKVLDEINSLEKELLPADKQSVNSHISTDKDNDEIFSSIAKRIKAIVFNDFEQVTIKKTSGAFYYILASIMLLIGILAAFVIYNQWSDWRISIIIFLMFGCISLFCVKNILFPTKFKVN